MANCQILRKRRKGEVGNIAKGIIMGAIALVIFASLGSTVISSWNTTALGYDPTNASGASVRLTGASATLAETVFPLVFVACGIILLWVIFMRKRA